MRIKNDEIWNVTLSFVNHIIKTLNSVRQKLSYRSNKNKTWVHFWIQFACRAISCNLWTVVAVLYSTSNEKIISEFMLFTRNNWHTAAEPHAKCNTIFCSLLAWDCNKSEWRTTISTLLTLCLHPTVDTGSRPNDVQHIWLSCQVHLLSTVLEIIHLLCELAKKKRSPNSALCKCKLYYTID